MQRTEPLNFDWRYAPDIRTEYLEPDYDDRAWSVVQLPHANVELPFNNFDQTTYQFESCYRKVLQLADFDDDTRLFARFEGVMACARVYLNGSFLAEHKGGYTGFRVDLTPAVRRDADNVLVVHVDSRERDDIPPCGYVIDYLTYGGIYREVQLEYRHRTHLESVLIKPRDVLSNRPALDLDLRLCKAGEELERIRCEFELLFHGQSVQSFEEDLELDGASGLQLRNCVLALEPADGLRLWDPDAPNLYELRIRLKPETSAAKVFDESSHRFGFREVQFRTNGFFLNGRQLKLRGLNRHQSFPYVGYAMPASAQRRDAEILKLELGANIARTAHYPQSRHFLDRCDELGLLVFEEIPGWQHIGDEEWKRVLLQNIEEMILGDGNHPSIILWGVRVNESQDDDELYTRTNALARELDSTRPTGGVRCFENSRLLEDVYTYNDFVHSGDNIALQKPRRVMGRRAPYLVTEHNGHMFPTKKYDDERHRCEQARRHLAVLDAAYADDEIAGAIGWCMFDYNTHRDFGSGDMICYHGVMDMFRIPKIAAAAYAAQSGERPVMQVASSMNIGENAHSLLGDVYVFTNLDSVKLYKGGEFVREFFPRTDMYPHLPQAPVIIDDFIGDAIEKNESFSRRDARIVKELLTKVSREGFDLGLLDRLKMGWLFLKNRMNFQHGEDLYTKYFGGWGGAADSYRFEGWSEGRCLAQIEFDRGDSTPVLSVELDANALREADTYDVTRCVVRLTDRNGNDLVYGHDAFRVSTEGPIEVIGPRTLALVGGSIGFWIKSTGSSGPARVIVESERSGSVVRELSVEKLPAGPKVFPSEVL